MAKTAKKQTTSKTTATNSVKTAETKVNTASASETKTQTANPTQTTTKAESSYSDKKSSYKVEVAKTTSNENLSSPYYRTTINEKVTTPTSEFSRTDMSSNTLQTTGMTIQKNQVYETTNTYDKKGRATSTLVHDTEKETSTTDAISTAQGYNGTTVNYTDRTRKDNYDKQGNLAHTETHEVIHGRTVNQRTDTKTTYNRGEITRTLRADNALAQLTLHDMNNAKKEEFKAQLSSNSEHYMHQKGNKQYLVEVDSDGNVSGSKNKLSDTKTTEMSKKETKKALKDMRKMFGDKMAELNGARTPEEYTKLLPSPMSIGKTASTEQIFKRVSDKERMDAEQVKQQQRQSFSQAQAADKELTAEQIAQARLQQLRSQQR